ncbi:MAG: hypothetical protein DF168_02091 [Candidatus Moanabacter tarae]|uniref:Magnesium and cobalt efflux protein CorC n=1 Tax=Candidatus Moanibacter tarae TaxID=2200854 RepID=A0A2Z4AKM3_9BACT|nr:MAG: hypothetical protein DF168_02091 [Candidatus Moanabacter tarae]|tara:strand:- start:6002 stop:7060 length:1059 start_codon:yes stop_codon:yes gene_type:complete
MTGLILPICFTLGVSGFCSLLEAFILSTTTSEIEALRKESPRQGSLLETFKNDIELTSSAILTLNTIANTMGAMWVASVAKDVAGNLVGIISFFMVLGILILSEILPKNMGVIYRRVLQKRLVYPLQLVRYSMYPLAYLTMHSIRLVVDKEAVEAVADEDEEITLLADKHAKDGSLTNSERDMIRNALSLDDVHISEIMTPRTVVTALDANLTVEEVFIQFRNIPFGRLPVYQESIDNVVGLVRRRDLLQAMANDQNNKKVSELMGEMTFVPETSSAAAALQHFLRTHQQLAMVVDEFGSTVGVVTVEDTIEHILGREIYEETDVAVDMRELARNQAEQKKAEESPPSNAPQ